MREPGYSQRGATNTGKVCVDARNYQFSFFFVKIRQHAFKAKCSYIVFSKQNTREMFSTYSHSQHYVYTYVRTLKLVLRGQVKHARTGTYTDRLHVNTWDGH